MTLVSEAAVPKGNRAPDPELTRERMGPVRVATPRRNPSTDQKKIRRQMGLQQPTNSQRTAMAVCASCSGAGRAGHSNLPCGSCGGSGSCVRVEATVLDTWAERLNPNDQIGLPNGKTQKVLRVRRHETDAQKLYVDTDGGTALVNKRDTFRVVPHNSQQQSMPGYGKPGGNSNKTPFGGHGGQAGSNEKSTTQCPSCGRNGSLQQRGDHYQCSHCGYQESFGGAGNHTFTDRPSIVQAPSRERSGLSPFASIIARRAHAVLAQEEQA